MGRIFNSRRAIAWIASLIIVFQNISLVNAFPFTENEDVSEEYFMQDQDIMEEIIDEDEEMDEEFIHGPSLEGIYGIIRPMSLIPSISDLKNDIQTEIAGGGGTVDLSSLMAQETLTENVSIHITQSVQVKIYSSTPIVLKNLGNQRHFTFNVDPGVEFELEFENVVLDGDGTGGGISVAGDGTFILRNAHIVNCVNSTIDGGAVHSVAGLIVLEGRSEISQNQARYGGGIYAKELLIKEGVVICGNTASTRGGGIYVVNNLKMTGGVVGGLSPSDGNVVTTALFGSGGGVYVENGPEVFISGNTLFANNISGNHGGGIYTGNQVQKLELKNNARFLYNQALKGATPGLGGAVYLSSVSSVLEIKDQVLIQGNDAGNGDSGNGGGIYTKGNILMTGGQVRENTAQLGGGISQNGEGASSLWMEFNGNSVISGNIASSSGGGIEITPANNGAHVDLTISGNSKITGNRAVVSGGGIYVSPVSVNILIDGDSEVSENFLAGNSGLQWGGGMYVQCDDVVLNIKGNAAFLHNKAPRNGGGIYLNDYRQGGNKVLFSENARFSGNEATNGGAVYAMSPLSVMTDGNVVFSNNRAARAAEVSESSRIAQGYDNIIKSNKFTTPFEHAWNNYDIYFDDMASIGGLEESYLVFFVYNDGIRGDFTAQKLAQTGIGVVKPQTDPQRDGYEFTAWYKDAGCTNLWNFDQDVAAGDTVIYAGWKARSFYTASFLYNDGDRDVYYKLEVLSPNQKITKPNADPVRAGYEFTGWYKESSCQNKWDFNLDKIGGNTNIYAGWEKKAPVKNTGGSGGSNNGSSGKVPVTVVCLNEKGEEIQRDKGYYRRYNTYIIKAPEIAGYILEDEREKRIFADIKESNNIVEFYYHTIYSEQTHDAYIFGYGNGMFAPDAPITRAEAAAMFSHLTKGASGEPSVIFQDVSQELWYNNAINNVTAQGIISGYPDGTFRPEQNVTRAEFTVMAMKYMGAEATEADAKFDDLTGHWAADYIAAASAKGFVSGYPDGNFAPDQNLSRAEAVTIVNRITGRYGQIEQTNEEVFSDVGKTHWAYKGIMEASVDHVCEEEPNGITYWK